MPPGARGAGWGVLLFFGGGGGGLDRRYTLLLLILLLVRGGHGQDCTRAREMGVLQVPLIVLLLLLLPRCCSLT